MATSHKAVAAASNVGGADPQIGYLPGITFSEPVFFCSVEAASVTAQSALDLALACLMREDPSLLVSIDPETGQTLLRGMGELHLEIIRSRLQHEFGLGEGKGDVEFGKMRISYRETLSSEMEFQAYRYTAGNLVSGPALAPTEAEASLSIRVEPLEEDSGVEIEIDGTGSILSGANNSPTAVSLRAALESGVRDGLGRGPLLGYQLTDLRIRVSQIVLSPTATQQGLHHSIRGCAARALATMLRQAKEDGSVRLLEPIMRADVQLGAGHLGDVLSDLSSKRRAQILDVGQLNEGGTGSSGSSAQQQQQQAAQARSYIHAEVPLSAMLGYATALRSTTQGNGSFSMQFLQFRQMPSHLERALVESPP